MLAQDQSREYNRFKKLKTFFTANTTVIAPYIPFQQEVTIFSDNLVDLDGLIQGKDGTSTGITQNKTAYKHSIADRLAVICTTTRAYAVKYANAELAAEMNFKATEIFKTKDADLLPFVLHMQTLITPLLINPDYIPYGVTTEMFTDLVADAQAFNGLIGQADVSSSGSSVANQNIDAKIKLLEDNIVQFDLLVNYFIGKNDDFVAGYHINSAVDRTGVRHSGIEGVVKANGQPVVGAIVKLANGKSVVTDLYGHYSLVPIMPGDYSIEITANGFTAKTFVYHINRGRVSTLDLELQAAA